MAKKSAPTPVAKPHKTPKKSAAAAAFDPKSLRAWEKALADNPDWKFNEGSRVDELKKAFPKVSDDRIKNVLYYMASMANSAITNLIEENAQHKFPKTPLVRRDHKALLRFALYRDIFANLNNTKPFGYPAFAQKLTKKELTNDPKLA